MSGKLLKSWQLYEKDNQSVLNRIQDISFSKDGRYLATISGIDAKVKLWDLAGNLVRSWQSKDKLLTAIDFKQDDKNLVTAGGKTIKLWSIQGELLQTISGHEDNILSVKFSPDGKLIATASLDNKVKIWDSRNGKLLRTLTHSNAVYSLSFSPDSQLLISNSGDRVYFWNMDGQLLHSMQSDEGKMLEVGFSQNEKLINLINDKNQITTWNLDIDDLQQHSCNWFQDYLKINNNLNRNNLDIGC